MLFENLIRAYLIQIALETILLHLQTDLNGIARTFLKKRKPIII
jgi:hypothetical protein